MIRISLKEKERFVPDVFYQHHEFVERVFSCWSDEQPEY
jgi:hypothetical protein